MNCEHGCHRDNCWDCHIAEVKREEYERGRREAVQTIVRELMVVHAHHKSMLKPKYEDGYSGGYVDAMKAALKLASDHLPADAQQVAREDAERIGEA